MTEIELKQYLNIHYPFENEKCEWKEFQSLKHSVSGRESEDIISYISAIANMEGGSLIIGIKDKTLDIVGIDDFYLYNIDNIKLKIFQDCTNLNTENFWVEEIKTSDSNKVIWIFHIPKHQFRLPVYAHKKVWQRLGDSLILMNKNRLDAIINEVNYHEDWSAFIIEGATINDLDKNAIVYARNLFLKKFPELSDECYNWSDIKFLNKAKITIKNKITRTAIILLGTSESEHFLIPSIAKIRWVLKTVKNEEKDYDIFQTPFLLAIDKIYNKIRNLKYRYLPSGTLFPNELLRYEPFNIREAINNCIAHNDYSMAGYINVIEFEDDILVFSNNGTFIPGSVEKVVLQDAPEENYRNRFLANAMFQLGLVDTRGGGIKKIYANQIKRYFPLPDYNLDDNKTVLTLTGKILNPEFAEILSRNPDIDLNDIFLLDRVQKKLDISDDDFKNLKKLKFIEGRKPNIFLSHSILEPIDDESLRVNYILNKSFDDNHFKEMIIEYLGKFGKTKRKSLDNLIIPKLSAVLSESQKKTKVVNLLTALRIEGKIESLPGYFWKLK